MPLKKLFKPASSGANRLLDSARSYEVYAQDAHGRGEEDLAQFFEGLAQFFYSQAEEISAEVANRPAKKLWSGGWRTWQELIEF